MEEVYDDEDAERERLLDCMLMKKRAALALVGLSGDAERGAMVVRSCDSNCVTGTHTTSEAMNILAYDGFYLMKNMGHVWLAMNMGTENLGSGVRRWDTAARLVIVVYLFPSGKCQTKKRPGNSYVASE